MIAILFFFLNKKFRILAIFQAKKKNTILTFRSTTVVQVEGAHQSPVDLSVRGVMTRRGEFPRYSNPY